MDNVSYENNGKPVLFYKDIFIIYMNIIKQALLDNKLDENIIHLANNELINVNRAPLIVLRRVDSPQPAAINNLNEHIVTLNNKKIVNGTSSYSFNLAFFCYGNSYLEAERLGSVVQKTLITTSINKIRKISNNSITGHLLLGWSGTNFLNNNSKLMSCRVDIRIETLLKYSTTI